MQHLVTLAFLISCGWLTTSGAAQEKCSLENGFLNPPAEARPLAWWHWNNGNISKEGIRADLEAMAQAGLAGVQLFDLAAGAPTGPIRYRTDAWYEHVQYAIQTAAELGLTFDLMNGPGFATSGGPWVTPEKSMKSFTWSEFEASGPARIHAQLPRPAVIPLGMTSELLDFYRDAALIAVPADALADEPCTVTTSVAGVSGEALIDGITTTGLSVTDTLTSFSIDVAYAQPVERRLLELTYSLIVDNHPGRVQGRIEATEDGITFRTLRDFDLRIDSDRDQPLIAFPFVITRARGYRVLLNNPSEMMATLSEARFSNAERLENYEGKTIRSILSISRPAASEVKPDPAAIATSQVIDLTGRLKADGTLDWEVPPGRWTILRCGYTSTGSTNHPISPESAGLEVDKMDSVAVRDYFEQSLSRIIREAGPRAGHTLNAVLGDSWEAGRQTWSASFPADFKQLRGYDITPWLPALTGRVVGSSAETEAFLADYRRTIIDLIAKNYYGTMRSKSHEHGLRYYAECYGSTSPINAFRCGEEADINMDEFWTRLYLRKNSDDAPSTKERASVAHVLGRSVFAAETFTAPAGEAWQSTPGSLKKLGDFAFINGVNRMVLHSFVHQPWSDRRPGLTLAQYGTEFGRHDTWWGNARAWVDYLARCQFLLQQGHASADLLLLRHDDMDQFIQDTYLDDVPFFLGPEGYDFDFIPPAQFMLTKTQQGKIELPSGATYRAIILPRRWVADVPLLQHLQTLTQSGVPMFGPPPVAPSGLRDLQENNPEWRQLVARLWPEPQPSVEKWNRHALQQFMAKHAIEQDFRIAHAPTDADVRYVHRATKDADIYFVTNQGDQPIRMTTDFRVSGRRPELWDPLTGNILPAAAYRDENGRTLLDLTLAPVGSIFVVFRKPAPPRFITAITPTDGVDTNAGGVEFASVGSYQAVFNDGSATKLDVQPLHEPIPLTAPWRVEFASALDERFTRDFERLHSWSEAADADERYFSGTATYRTTFTLPTDPLTPDLRCRLDLGQVCDLADLRVNSQSAGTLWTQPFSADVTSLVKPGVNTVEIAITNTWVNRLIGEEHRVAEAARSTTGTVQVQRRTYTPYFPYNSESPLRPSGLLGPVVLSFSRVIPLTGNGN